MTSPLPPPFIFVEGVRNFRDFGVYPTQSGQTVQAGKLFRSANYAQVTDAGRAKFRETGIKVVVDLRRSQEREMQPSQLDGLEVEILSSSLGDGDGVTLPPHLQFIRDTDLTQQATHDHMMSSYRRIPWEPQHLTLFSATFDRLAEGKGPVVIHCAAGKDRTGILCGLILYALGVDLERIKHDYLLTNHVAHDPNLLAQYAMMMGNQFDKHIDPDALMPMVGVHQDFLVEAWAEMARRDGGLDGYLERLGVDAAKKRALADYLLTA